MMDHISRRPLRFLILCLSALILSTSVAHAHNVVEHKPPNTHWTGLSRLDQTPLGFEPYLRRHPSDIVHRVAAIFYYNSVPRHALGKLRYHSLALIRIDPNITEIFFFNDSYLLFTPSYGHTLLAALREEDRKGRITAAGYWVMAMIDKTIALPALPKNSQGDAFFLKWFGIPANAKLRTRVDIPTAIEAAKYFRLSLAAPESNDFLVDDSYLEMARTLDKAGRPHLAAAACRKALELKNNMYRADTLLIDGISLHDDHRDQAAMDVLETVEAAEQGAGNDGIGGDAVSAQMEMGLIALDHGNIEAANQHLLSATKLDPGLRAPDVGLPLVLAGKLLDLGQRVAVTVFCKSALQICPGQPDTEALLHRAEAH